MDARHMKTRVLGAAFAAVLSVFVSDALDSQSGGMTGIGLTSSPVADAVDRLDDGSLRTHIGFRHADDVAAMKAFRPGFEFWESVFTIPDGSIAFGSALDGHSLALFPTKGDWSRQATFHDNDLSSALDGMALPRKLDDRRDYVAAVFENIRGPIVHNPTRGSFVTPGARRYGAFLSAWGSIYERFGVPAEVGLAQAMIESGFDGLRKSEARAVGLCQWLSRNWKVLDRLDPAVIEINNQTTQAAYCGAYISVLATKYGSFIPALSAHHAGETNVGRAMINGERLQGTDGRARYFLGAQLARDLRTMWPDRFSDLYGSYGPRSYRYAEMVFGNTANVNRMIESTPQAKIYAMRTSRAVTLAEIQRRTRLSAEEIRRYNPALRKKVPAGATIYLPRFENGLGGDVAFWNRAPKATYENVLNDFVRLDASPAEWDTPSFDALLEKFERRFEATKTQEGTIMATVLAYVRQENATSGRRDILSEFRSSDHIRELFDQAVRERAALTN
jgi:hypothetical protein